METSGYNLCLIMKNGKARIIGVYVMAQYVLFLTRAKSSESEQIRLSVASKTR
jgi:hypothetical protein